MESGRGKEQVRERGTEMGERSEEKQQRERKEERMREIKIQNRHL